MKLSLELKQALNKKFIESFSNDNSFLTTNAKKHFKKNILLNELWMCFISLIGSMNLLLAVLNNSYNFFNINIEMVVHIAMSFFIGIYFFLKAKKNHFKLYKSLNSKINEYYNNAFFNKVIQSTLEENLKEENSKTKNECILLVKQYNEGKENFIENLIKENKIFNKNELLFLYLNSIKENIQKENLNIKKIEISEKQRMALVESLPSNFDIEKELLIMNKKINEVT